MELETKIQRAINIIEKRPGIRTDELARALGVEPAKVAPLIFAATANGFILSCKVERPGKQATNEYRLSSGVVASGWDEYRSKHTAEQRYRSKNTAEQRKAALPSAARRDTTTRKGATTPAAGGANISGSHVSETLVEGGSKRTVPSAEDVAVVEQPVQDEMPAPAGSDEIDDLRNQLAHAENALGEWLRLANNYGCEGWHQLRSRLETLHTLAANDIDEPVDVKDVAVAYLVRAPKRKPRLCIKPERAVEAAKAAAKTAGRADVLALVPVGSARARKALSVEFTEAA